MISSLLHLVGLRPRVYYTVTNFGGGGGGRKAPCPPPSICQCHVRWSSENTDSVDWLPVFLVIMFLDVTLCRLHISQNIILSALEYMSHVRPIFQLSCNFLTLVVFSYSSFFFFYGFIGFCFLRRGNSIKKSPHAVINFA